MKRLGLLIILLLSAAVASAQVSSQTTRRVRAGLSLPATCRASNPVDVFIRTGATNPGFYICSATNTWSGPFDVSADSGDVVGPASSTDNAVARYDLTTGKLLQNSLATVSDTGTVNIPAGQTYNINGVPVGAGITNSAANGQVAISDGTNIVGDADLTFSGDTLTATKFAGALNGTVGATTPAAGAFTTGSFSGNVLASGLIQFSGTSASFPALKRSTTNLQVRLADDSDFAPLTASKIQINGTSFILQPSGIDGSTVALVGGDFTTLRRFKALELYFSVDDSSSVDTQISRQGVGVLQIGTTAANSAGSLLLTNLTASGYISNTAPVTKTGDFTWGVAENWIIVNQAGTTTATLPAAASFTGRILHIKTVQAQAVVSASSNVVPLVGGAAGTAILPATAGQWATLVSDGTNWVIMESNG